MKALVQGGREADAIHVVYLDQVNYRAAYETMSRLLDAEDFIYDGIFATSDWLALGCYNALTEHGYSIPEEVKLVGYDDISITQFNAVPITTVHQQIDIMGKTVVEQLLRILGGESALQEVVKVPVYLNVRESTRGRKMPKKYE